jgi:peptide/nickel transport system substrate-binding protein
MSHASRARSSIGVPIVKIEAVQEELQRAGINVSRRDLVRYAMAGGAALSLGLPALGGNAAAQDATPVQGGIWRMAVTSNPTAYPITAPAALIDIIVNKTMYNNLVKYKLTDGAIEVVPDLAESWEANDDLTQFTFTLREGATWHDGQPVTVEDVKFTFDAILDPDVAALFKGNLSAVESVEIVDDRNIAFNLTGPYAPLPVMLGYNQAIVPKHLLEGQDLNQPVDFLSSPVGSGPFKFKEFSQGSYLEVEANPDYFGGAPNLDGIIFQVITDGNARVAQVKSGDVDFTVIEPPQIDSVSDDANLKIVEATQVNYYFLAFNHTIERFQDPRVRQALTLALNREAIVETVLKGYGQVANGPTHPSLGEYYNPDVTKYGYDQDAAKALLEEAGWTPGDDGILVNEAGEKFTILLNGPAGYPVLEQLLTYAQQEYANLGIEVTLEIDEWSVHLDKYQNLQYDMLNNWWITPPDPDLYDHYHSESPSNWWAYGNPELNELLAQARQEADHATRVDLYHQIQQYLSDDVPVVYLYHQVEIQVMSQRTEGLPQMGYRDALSWAHQMWVTE